MSETACQRSCWSGGIEAEGIAPRWQHSQVEIIRPHVAYSGQGHGNPALNHPRTWILNYAAPFLFLFPTHPSSGIPPIGACEGGGCKKLIENPLKVGFWVSIFR